MEPEQTPIPPGQHREPSARVTNTAAQSNESSANALLAVFKLIAVLYLFFLAITLMGGTFKLFGGGFAKTLIETTANPIVGLFIGILATSIIQSSSTTTSIVVTLVASGTLTIDNAIPIVMGANVGTSVTNTLVSMAHITRREEFRRAVAGATVHDFFNLMAVAVLLPVELLTGYLSKFALWFEGMFESVGGLKLVSPLKVITKPVVKFLEHLVLDTFGLPQTIGGIILLVGALALLFFSLKQFVNIMRKIVVGRVERVIHDVLFESPLRSFGLGLVLTSIVQSSSITTSLIVPMIGAGILTVEQFYPFTLGANIGTTVTSMMAALATGSAQGVTIAFVHLLFNISGCAIFYPLRALPIRASHLLGKIAAENRYIVIVYILVTFFLLPLLLIFLTR